MNRVFRRLVAAVALLGSCSQSNDPYFYDYAYYDTYYYAYDADYFVGWYDPFGVYYFAADDGTIDLSAAAVQIAARASTYFTPEACVMATPSGPTINYVFSGCTGKYSGKAIDGLAQVTLAQQGNALIFVATAPRLTVDGRHYTLDIKAAGTAAGAQRSLAIVSNSFVPEQFGGRTSTGTVTWTQGDPCITVDATGTSLFGNFAASSTISGYSRCGVSCPSAGNVTVTSDNGTFAASYTGGDQLTVIGPQGNNRTFDLQCE